jgi:imidazolonepropionase-like amidohydrolase
MVFRQKAKIVWIIRFFFAIANLPILAAPSEDITAFVGGTLIDGTGNKIIENSIILVEREYISAVGHASEIIVPEGANVVDVAGKWITPGLIDAHVHFMESGRIYTMPRYFDLTHIVPYSEEVAWIRERLPVSLQSFLCAGVTSAVSAGGPSIEYDARRMAAGLEAAPNIFVAHGPITSVPSDKVFLRFESDTPLRTAISRQEARARVREASDWGADLIKGLYFGGMFREAEKNYQEIQGAIIDEAKKHGFVVTMHVKELEAARNLVRLGAHSLQHTPIDAPVDYELIDLMVKKGTIIVPTLAVYRRLLLEIPTNSVQMIPIEHRCGDPDVKISWEEVDMPDPPKRKFVEIQNQLKLARSNVQRLYRGGIPIATGSDAGVIGLLYGASLHYELQLLSEAGLSNADLIVAATLNSARVAGKDDLIGSVQSGKLADFLILSANPLEDIGNLQKIETVVKSGIAWRQEQLLPLLEHAN